MYSRMETGRGRGRGGGGGRNSGRGGRGGGCGGRGGRSAKMHNGVDITDLTRNFSNDEWRKLSPEIIQQVRDAREAGKAVTGAKKRNVAAMATEPEEELGDKPDEEQQDQVASNGVRFGSGAYSNKKSTTNRRS